VRVEVFDVRGRRVMTLLDAARPPGRHVVSWQGRSNEGQAVSTGVYFVVMEAEGFRATKRIALLK